MTRWEAVVNSAFQNGLKIKENIWFHMFFFMILSSCCPLLGSHQLAPAQAFLWADGVRRGPDAPQTSEWGGGGGGSQRGGDTETHSLLPTRAQGRLPQLLLEDLHIMLTPDRNTWSGSFIWLDKCFLSMFEIIFFSEDLSRINASGLKKKKFTLLKAILYFVLNLPLKNYIAFHFCFKL